jgi:hypothetical protein
MLRSWASGWASHGHTLRVGHELEVFALPASERRLTIRLHITVRQVGSASTSGKQT